MENAHPGDREIIVRIKAGDIDYFAYIVKRYTPRIFSYIHSRLFEKEEAEDLVQNIFVSFYKAVDRFDEDKPLLPYLYEIARNELKMYYRSRRDTVPLNDTIISSGELFTEHLEKEEMGKALSAVSPLQRKALEMVYEGYSYQEIADKLGKNINTVRTIIRRARQLLISKRKDEKT